MKIAMYLIFICLVFVIYVWYLEETTIFHPQRELTRTPGDAGLLYEDVYFITIDQVQLHAWFVKGRPFGSPLARGMKPRASTAAKSTGKPVALASVKSPRAANTVVFFHGNAGNIADRIEKAQLFIDMGLNVLMVDYRGYGKSAGKPSEAGIYKDALAAYDYLSTRDEVDVTRLIVYGASLGGAVAIDLAAQRNVGALVIDSSFSSAADMARVIFPFVPSFLIRTKMDSAAKVKSMSVPKLFLHSRSDEIVPFLFGQKLFNAAAPPKEFIELSGTHNDGYISSQDAFINSIEKFLKQYNLF